MSRKGSVKVSSGSPSSSEARTSSSAVTRRSPFSIAESVCRSLKPKCLASTSWLKPSCSRSALMRAPTGLAVMGSSWRTRI
jgi:hypothetical protein